MADSIRRPLAGRALGPAAVVWTVSASRAAPAAILSRASRFVSGIPHASIVERSERELTIRIPRARAQSLYEELSAVATLETAAAAGGLNTPMILLRIVVAPNAYAVSSGQPGGAVAP